MCKLYQFSSTKVMLGTTLRRLCWLLVACVAVAIPACALDAHRSLKDYGHQTWQTDNGLPENTVNSIIQSSSGYLWLGTEGGLVRFDGLDFTNYNTENTSELKSNTIYDLFEDASGDLWVSTANGLMRNHQGIFHSFLEQDGLPANVVWCTYRDRRGTLLAITANGVAAYRDGRFQRIGEFSSIDVLTREAITEDSQGILWIATGNNLLRISEQTYKPAAPITALDHVEASAVQIDRTGKVWIASGQTLGIFTPNQKRVGSAIGAGTKAEIAVLLTDPGGGMWVGTSAGLIHTGDGRTLLLTTAKGLPGNRIQTLFRDKQGALWIGTDQGVARYFAGVVQSLRQKDGVTPNAILSIFEDREGNVWFGSDAGGLTILRDQTLTTYTTTDGLSGDLVRAVIEDAAGRIWIGTNGSGLNRSTAKGFRAITTAQGLTSNVILALASMPDGDLWVGTPDGLNRIHGGKILTFTSADGLPDDFVRSLLADEDGSLWIGTRRGLAHWINGKFVNYSRQDGLGSDFIGAMSKSKSGSLWIGTSGGLTSFSRGIFSNLTTKDGLSSNVITAIYEDAQQTLWLGTNGGGLNRLRKGKLQALRSEPGGMPDTIYGILEDQSSNLWLGARNGIFRVARQDLQTPSGALPISAKVVRYGAADGMKIRECSGGGHPAAWKRKDGALWFATLRGVSFINPARDSQPRVAPLIAIESVFVDDREMAVRGTLQLSPASHRLEVRYAGLSFADPQNVHYRYRLEGFDPEWIDAGTRRAAFYTNLPPGKYRFHVYAGTKDGIWSVAGAEFELHKHPHFYEAWWFYLLVCLAAALLAYGVYQYRVLQVESRFGAVLQERGRIAREIHDTLAQDLVGVSVQLEVVSRLMTASADAARKQLNEARILVRKGIEDARTSIWDLRSHGNEDLPAMLTAAVNAAASHSSAKVSVQVKGTYRPLEKKIEAELLRIAQEAVTNAARHAAANHIDVVLNYDSFRLRMSIEDDGRGFSGAETSVGPVGHFGIKGMRERAGVIHAQLTLKSEPGAGTVVSIDLPVT